MVYLTKIVNEFYRIKSTWIWSCLYRSMYITTTDVVLRDNVMCVFIFTFTCRYFYIFYTIYIRYM